MQIPHEPDDPEGVRLLFNIIFTHEVSCKYIPQVSIMMILSKVVSFRMSDEDYNEFKDEAISIGKTIASYAKNLVAKRVENYDYAYNHGISDYKKGLVQ